MGNVKIGRYDTESLRIDGRTGDVSKLTDHYEGWVEGESTDGERWIIWLGADGRPAVYFAHREEDGAVIGDGQLLGDEHHQQ